jgi:hypothetical protein
MSLRINFAVFLICCFPILFLPGSDGHSDFISRKLGSESAFNAVVDFGSPVPSYESFSVTTTAPSQLGYFTSAAGDVNGDGYKDFLIGANGFDNSNGMTAVIYGSAFPTNLNIASMGTNGAVYFGSGTEMAGISTASAGDMNRDGYADFLIGASHANSNAGKVYFIYGSPHLKALNALHTLDVAAGVSFTETVSDSLCGNSVSSGGDVNGDGYDDILIGCHGYASFSGKAYLVYGKPVMTNLTLNTMSSVTDGFVIIGNSGVQSYFAYSVAIVGDINRDSYSDIAIGE